MFSIDVDGDVIVMVEAHGGEPLIFSFLRAVCQAMTSMGMGNDHFEALGLLIQAATKAAIALDGEQGLDELREQLQRNQTIMGGRRFDDLSDEERKKIVALGEETGETIKAFARRCDDNCNSREARRKGRLS